MAGSTNGPAEAASIIKQVEPLRDEFQKALESLLALNGTELAQAGRLGQRRLSWVQELDAKALQYKNMVVDKLAPGKQKAREAYQAWTTLENEMVAPAEAIRSRAKPVISAFQLELNRQAEVEAARLREQQRRAEEEQRKAQEAEAARLREEAAKLAAQDAAAAEEKLAEAEFVQAQPIVPIAVTAEQIAAPKVDAGREVFWRAVVTPGDFLNWAMQQAQQNQCRIEPRPDNVNETVIEFMDWSITVNFGTSWKSKGADLGIPGIAVYKGYETRIARSRR